MTTQTNHKTFNKTLKKELVNMFPEAARFSKTTINYNTIYLIKNSDSKIIARVEKSKDIFKGMVITKN